MSVADKAATGGRRASVGACCSATSSSPRAAEAGSAVVAVGVLVRVDVAIEVEADVDAVGSEVHVVHALERLLRGLPARGHKLARLKLERGLPLLAIDERE